MTPIKRTALLSMIMLSLATSTAFAVDAPPPRASRPVVPPVKPIAVPQIKRVINSEAYRIELDLSKQILAIRLPETIVRRDGDQVKAGDTIVVLREGANLSVGRQVVARLMKGQRLSVTRTNKDWVATAVRVDGRRKSGWLRQRDVKRIAVEGSMYPTLAHLGSGGFTSAAALLQKAKQFDDGLYAAVEYAAQVGAGKFSGKRSLLSDLSRALSSTDGHQPLQVVLAACRLGNAGVEVPQPIAEKVDGLLRSFQKDPLRSKPIGFYTWTPELSAIFRQDRMLQSELTGSEGIDALVKALHANKSALKTYRSCLALNYKLTNPPAKKDLLASLASLDDGSFSPPHDGVHFFPASVSRETELMKRLYRGKPIPADFNLMDELIRRIRSRDIDLTPRADSGWYDHQTWALAPLVLPDQTPEAKHLRLNDHYRVALTKLFKGSLALARETHVKQLETELSAEAPPADIRPKVYIRPELSAEPLATMYLRRALSYRFVRSVLEETFGRPAIKKMYRHTASGPVDVNLDEELLGMEALFHGAHVTVCRQIGLSEDKEAKVGSGQGPAADAARFLAWGANPQGDLDLGRDARMMVPVFHNAQRGKTKVWVFLGWTTQRVEIGYVRQPTAQVFDADGNRVTDDTGPELIYYGERKTIATPVMAEVYVTKLLNREEFREHCDIYAKPSAILNNLK